MTIDLFGDAVEAAPRPPAGVDDGSDAARALASAAAAAAAGADAVLLIRRVGDALEDLALAVDGLQAGLGPAVAAAAVRDPAVLLEAQKLDLVSQSLRGVIAFLAAAGQRRIGQEPLHLDRLAASLTLKGLADRLAGATPEAADGEADWF